MEQSAVERLLRKRIKEAFDEAGIAIPYPRRIVYHDKGQLDQGGISNGREI